MELQKRYCSGCDRHVHIVATETPRDDTQANVPEPELVCLEIGEWCTGALCPLGAAEPSAMVSRLIRNGLSLEHLTVARAWCDACGLENDMALYGKAMGACLVCGTARAMPAR